MPPQFLAIGHIVQDIVPTGWPFDRAQGWRLGGTVSFASLLAARLGLRAAVLTSASPEMDVSTLLPGVEVVCLPAERTTRIENVYGGRRRLQYLRSHALSLTAETLPPAWRDAAIVLLGPLAGEVDAAVAACFPSSLLGVSAQGWLRRAGPDSKVRLKAPRSWRAAALLQHAQVLFVSEEDLSPRSTKAALDEWSRQVPILAFTRGEAGADICHRGEWRHIEAFPAPTIDPTGAGDAFAAAFLIRYHEGAGAWEAARFAAAASSFVVEGEGVANIPDRSQIEGRLNAHPEIRCWPPVSQR